MSEMVCLESVARRLDGMQNNVSGVNRRLISLECSLTERAGALEARTAALEGSVDQLADRIGALETSVNSLIFLVKRIGKAQRSRPNEGATHRREEGFYWVILGQNPPEVAYWERREWSLAGDLKPWQADAVTVVSDRLGVQSAIDAGGMSAGSPWPTPSRKPGSSGPRADVQARDERRGTTGIVEARHALRDDYRGK